MKERDEAERIYQAIFKSQIPQKIRERYFQAADILFSRFSPEENQAFDEALKKVSDLEALEVAARLRKKMPPLVFRFRLMVYLAENLPANQSVFVNSRSRRIISYFSLFFGGLRTLCKFVKGWFLLRRVGDA